MWHDLHNVRVMKPWRGLAQSQDLLGLAGPRGSSSWSRQQQQLQQTCHTERGTGCRWLSRTITPVALIGRAVVPIR